MSITRSIANHKKLFWYTFLSYADKAIAFVLPLLALYVYNDKVCYNTIEYVYSVAMIAVTPFGLHSGAFYFYKEAQNKDKYIKIYRRASSFMLLVMLLTTLLGVVFWNMIDSKITLVIGFCVCMRMVLLVFLNQESAYYRLIDKAPRISEISILINLASALIVILVSFVDADGLVPFFIVGIIVPMMFCIRNLSNGDNVTMRDIKEFLRKSYSYSWLLMLNYILGIFVSNYCKLYGFNRLSTEDMYVFSYTLRISMIMQMAHMSICSYYSKQLYEKGYSPKFIAVYLIYISLGCLGCLLFMFLQNVFTDTKIPISAGTFIVMMYVIVYYSSSLMEIFFNRRNRNTNILALSVISMAIFLAMLKFSEEMNLLSISLAMLVFAAVRFTLYATRVYAIKRHEA